MKRNVFLNVVMLLAMILLNVGMSIAGDPKIVYGTIRDSGGSFPADADFSFNAYITVRPGEVLTKASTGCGYNEGTGQWIVQVGNFSTNWSVGEVLHVDFTDTGAPGGTETGSVEVTLDDSGSQQTQDTTLPVELSSFSAKSGDGGVTLRWTTESEVDNLGFHIYRSLAEEGEYERITAELIEGAGTASNQQTYTFTDPNVTNGMTYWYKLEDVAFDGIRTMHGAISVTPQMKEEVVVVLPDAYVLSPCYPNPFNPSTSVRYQLPEPGEVRLAIYDVLGQEVRMLVSEIQPAGWYCVSWDGRDEAGQPVSSGVYLYRLEAGADFVRTHKALLLR